MEEAPLRQLLLVRACEEEDPQAVFVPEPARRRAERQAREKLGREPETAKEATRHLVERAAALGERIRGQHPGIVGTERFTQLTPRAWTVAGVALALGFAFDALGSGRRISLLAFPLLGTLLWNGAVILGQLGWSLVGHRAVGSGPERIVRVWQALRVRLGSAALAKTEADFSRRALARFAGHWLDVAGPLEAARWRARLHVGAMAFAMGVVAGMYVAGIAFEYRATWESTFLDADQVRAMLATILGPASRILDLPIPNAAGIGALESPDSGDAAPWIHRWAMTALLFVAIPRSLLALREAARVRALARDLSPDWEDAYFARLLAGFRGEGEEIRVLPYSVRLSPEVATRVHELVRDLFGNRALVRVEEPIAYGDPPQGTVDAVPRATVVVFNLAQSPEQEVHGVYLEALRDPGHAQEAHPLLVLLDETAYREKASAERVEERRSSWGRVMAEAEIEAVSLSADRDSADLLGGARRALTGGPA